MCHPNRHGLGYCHSVGKKEGKKKKVVMFTAASEISQNWHSNCVIMKDFYKLEKKKESPETPLIISPVFALRPHGQASKTSGQIGAYECKHPACHTVSVRASVDVDKKQLDGDSQSSQTPRRRGF